MFSFYLMKFITSFLNFLRVRNALREKEVFVVIKNYL